MTVDWVKGEGIQGKAYDRCLNKVKDGRLAEWIAFFDVDEYLFLQDHGCLMDFLRPLDDRAALVVNWRTFAPSNHILPVPRDRLLIEANVYTRGDEEDLFLDQHVKSIVHVNRTALCNHPHFCVYEEGWVAKDEWGQEIDDAFNLYYPRERHVHLHHYQVRSYADFLMKRLRGRADAVNATANTDDIALYLNRTGSWTSLREDIKPAVAPVRRILGLDQY